MAKKYLIAGIPSKKDYILRLKGMNMFHRVPALNLSEAKYKFLKGMKNVNERDIIVKK
jgi:hypothetical protein